MYARFLEIALVKTKMHVCPLLNNSYNNTQHLRTHPLNYHFVILCCYMIEYIFWTGTLFLEFWKRRQASMQYKWDLLDYVREEVSIFIIHGVYANLSTKVWYKKHWSTDFVSWMDGYLILFLFLLKSMKRDVGHHFRVTIHFD